MDSSVRDQLESEVVYDRRVATYKWLASKFDLHTNTAKRYLKEFTNEQEADGTNVIGHSIVTGKQDKLYRIILTASQSVLETKKDLTTVTGVHAFSAQPSNLEDCIDRLTEAATSNITLSVCPIYCEAAQRTRGAGKGLNGSSTAAERKAVSPTKPSPHAQESKPAPTKNEPVKREKDKPTPTSKASAKSKPKQNDLAAAFFKARTGGASTTSKSTPPAEKKDAVDTYVTPKGASSSGEAAKRKSVDKSPSEKATPEKKRIKTEVPASPEVPSATRKKPSRRHVISDSEDEEDETTQSTTPASSENLSSAVSSAATTSEGDKPSAKSSPDSAIQGGQKKRRRVMKSVKKTFKDEEGFLVTKLVKELVSESDDDDEDPVPKNLREKVAAEKPAGKKKAAASTDKKQQSLLSFFGKK